MKNLNNWSFAKFFYKFRNGWNNFWSTKIVTKKILFTITLLTFYIILTTIKAPFVKIRDANAFQTNTFFKTLDLVGGGGLRNFSLAALGIGPFINASLIMSLLQTRAFPAVHKLSQSGPQGRRKLNVITRILTLFLAFPQAILLGQSLAAGTNPFIEFVPLNGSVNLTAYFVLPMILIGGSLFALFIGEQITDKGVGNGTSLIIFVGIAMALPAQFKGAFQYLIGDDSNTARFVGGLKFLTYLFVYAVLLFIIGLIYNSERHIPIQQVGSGRSRNIKEMGKLPIKLNPGGIMPIIFSTMIISVPLMIARILPRSNSAALWINENMQFTAPLGLSLLIVITFFFSFIMGLQQSKVDRISEDFAKNGTFIPGIRPGEQTEDYLIAIVMRLATFSGFWLVFLASFRYIQILAFNVPQIISFGGTGMMIIVSVALETINQLKARLKTSMLSKQKMISRRLSEEIMENTEAYEGENSAKNRRELERKYTKNGDGLLW